jgi:hypothetical protein
MLRFLAIYILPVAILAVLAVAAVKNVTEGDWLGSVVWMLLFTFAVRTALRDWFL